MNSNHRFATGGRTASVSCDHLYYARWYCESRVNGVYKLDVYYKCRLCGNEFCTDNEEFNKEVKDSI